VAQRIVRAKRTLTEARVPYELPQGAALGERLASVLEVVYLIFNEGYTATAGGDWMRPALCDEALRLGRMLAQLAPDQPEVHGLVALMEIQASRTAARTDSAGNPVLLMEQDRKRWDPLLIRRGLVALERAESLGGALGPYALQAAIAACHARAHAAKDTDWKRIAALYDALAQATPSPWPWRTGRRRDWRSSTRCRATRRCATTNGCRACAATCWKNSGAATKRARNSSAPRRWRRTRGSVSCCWHGQRR
jgi:predicted RNA polymerase sigma factor